MCMTLLYYVGGHVGVTYGKNQPIRSYCKGSESSILDFWHNEQEKNLSTAM